MCTLDENQIPRACLGDAEVLALGGGPFEREMDESMNTDRGARPENNLKRSCVY